MSTSVHAQQMFDTAGEYTYTVPSNGILTVTARGADGALSTTTGTGGGAGATVESAFAVQSGDVLTVVVGEPGEPFGPGRGGGGGGSAVIATRNGSTTLLVAAGAGGGGGTTSGGGGQATLASSGRGGTAGSGNDPQSGGGGAGGGGFGDAGSDPAGAQAFAEGGEAGTLSGLSSGGRDGGLNGSAGGAGFGGGGGGDLGGGGGGGFVGGDGGNGGDVPREPGQGGGSFVETEASEFAGTVLTQIDGGNGAGSGRDGRVELSVRPPDPNRALNLNGTDDYVRADGVSGALAGAGALTMEAWVFPTGGTEQQGLLTFHTDTGGNRNLLLYRSGQFQYYDGENTGYVGSRNAFPAGQWYHVALTIDASDVATLYVNGRAEATFTTTVRPAVNGLFSIGQEWDGSTASDFFEGRIDEVRIWSEARTQAQLQQGMTTSLGTDNTLGDAFDLTDLVAHYRFEGNTLDETGTYPATVQGAPTYESDVEQAPAEEALIVRVNAAISGGAGNGTSWTAAHADLQDGLAGTGPENEIWIADGTYTPGPNRGDSFTITGAQDGIGLYGGFVGTETTRSERDPITNATILSGDLGGDDGSDSDGDGIPDTGRSENAYHVLVFNGGNGTGMNSTENITTNTVLDGVTITGGNANDVFAEGFGGGLYCDGFASGNACSPSLTGLTFTGNSAVIGGAIYNEGSVSGTSSPVITNATFIGNTADDRGGAIYFSGDGGSVAARVTNSLFANNGAHHVGFDDGDAGEQPRFVNCTFTGATDFAFDIPFYNSGQTPLTVVNSVLWDNGPGGIAGTGGTVADPDGAVDVTFSMVEEARYAAGSGDANAGAGNINQDPLFADASGPAGPDGTFGTADDGLRLTNGSPAIARGTYAPFEAGGIAEGVTTDLAGDDRRFGLFPDLGAYELSTIVSTSDQITGASDLVGYVEPTGFGGLLLLRSPAGGDLTFTRTDTRPESPDLPANVAPVTWQVTSSLTPAPTYDLVFDVSSLSGIGDFSTLMLYKSDDGGQTWDAVNTFSGASLVRDEDRALVAVQDLTGFSQFAIASTDASNPLPVELAGFEAQRSGPESVTVQWQTLSETNNAGFEVQRRAPSAHESANGSVETSHWGVSTGGVSTGDVSTTDESWHTIARLNGAGTTDTPQSYRFDDTRLPYAADSLRYRLRQIDADGTESFSEAVTIGRPVQAAELLPTYPNPARSQATVRFAVPERQDVRITLYDMLGRRIRTVVDTSAEGRTEAQFDVSALASGTYFLRMRTDAGPVDTQRITVVR